MSKQGHEIASHTWSHRSLPSLSVEDVRTELTQTIDAIKKEIGLTPLTLAFPFNQSTPAVQKIALEYHVAYRAKQLGTRAARGPRSASKNFR